MLLKIFFNTDNKYISKIIIKKLAFEKMGKMCIFLLISITTETLANNIVVACNKMNFKFVQISQPATEQVLHNYCALETLVA